MSNTNDEILDTIEQALANAGFEIASEDELAAVMEQGKHAITEHDDRARAEGRRFLDEEKDRGIIEAWWTEAQHCASIDDACAFAHRLVTDYRHDYGTICHAIAAAGVAMANAVEHSPEGGVTGFQAGAIGWMLHSKWMQWSNEPRRLQTFNDLLYPQYDDQWCTIKRETADWLQQQARELLAMPSMASGTVRQRWEDVASGRFPPFVTVEGEGHEK